MPLEREGWQAQFIVCDHAPTPQGSELEALLTWLQENLARDLTLADGAERAGTSTRTLIRRFRNQTGTTPLQWLRRAHIRQAQHLLETKEHSVERIGSQVDFGSPTTFRDRFKRTPRVSPQTYRRTPPTTNSTSPTSCSRGSTCAPPPSPRRPPPSSGTPGHSAASNPYASCAPRSATPDRQPPTQHWNWLSASTTPFKTTTTRSAISRLRDLTRGGDYAHYVDIAHRPGRAMRHGRPLGLLTHADSHSA